MRESRPWTEADRLELEQLRFDGLTAREIAPIVHRTIPAVYEACARFEIPCLSRSDERWLDLFQRGLSNGEAARIMGRRKPTAVAARGRLRRAGFDLPWQRAVYFKLRRGKAS